MGLWKKTKSFLAGKKTSETMAEAPESAEQTQARLQGYDALAKARQQIDSMGPVEQQAQFESQQEQKQLAGSLGDVKRRVQELMARRGMSNTSVGLGAQIGAEREIQDRMADIQASLPERIRQLRLQRAQALSSIGQAQLGAAGQKQYYSNERSGGFLPALLGGASTAFGQLAGSYMSKNPSVGGSGVSGGSSMEQNQRLMGG